MVLRRVATGLATALVALAAGGGAAVAAPPPVNPWTGPTGTAGQHGDSLASDTTPLPGPSGAIRTTAVPLGAVCPSVLIGADDLPVALCTSIADRAPVAFLLDPGTGEPLATLHLTAGSLFAGVYPYLDDRDRLVVVDGSGALLRIAHRRDAAGRWTLAVERSTPLVPQLAGRCEPAACGGVVGLAPDFRGRVWFATEQGYAGYVGRDDRVRAIRLGTGETVANSIATAPGSVAVATDHAQYVLQARAGRQPRVRWRRAYDRGPARKPGQLSRGTGSTPTFFGPRTGAELLALVDNAAPVEHLLVLDVRRGTTVCDTPVLGAGSSGSENSPIGFGRSVVVASTYGYPYPATPESAGPAVPETAPFAGGMTRVDVRRGGCVTRWTNATRSAAVPKLSIPDRRIYTVNRRSPTGGSTTGPLDVYQHVAIDLATGTTRSSQPVAAALPFDTLQLAGNVGPGRVLWQGTTTGVLRIAPTPG